MDAKVVAVLVLVLAALCLSDGECARRQRLARRPALGSGLCVAAASPPPPMLPRANPVRAALHRAMQPISQDALPRLGFQDSPT